MCRHGMLDGYSSRCPFRAAGAFMGRVRSFWPPSPIQLLSIAWLITIVVLMTFLWCAYDSYQRLAGTARQNLRIQELRGKIIHLDEALTMSARIGALTGDSAWLERYKRLEPELDSALSEVQSSSLGVQTTSQTDAANEALVGMEHRSFELVRQGKRGEASTLLFSPEYLAQKAIYSEGMDQLGNRLMEASNAAMRAERSRVLFQLSIGAGVIVLLIAGWPAVVRFAKKSLEVRNQLEKVERDLDLAREIQRGLLPGESPDTPGFEIVGWSKPADQTGGDYFDWMKLPDGGTLITLADVTGHGIGPALIVAVCRAYMRATAAGTGVALGQAISRVNELLALELPAGRFVTAAIGVLRPESNELSLISAGQAPLYFYRAKSRTVESWIADDLPLGIASDLTFEAARRVEFEPGDALILATDGFFEWANPDGDQYGTGRLEAFVAAHAHEDPSEMIGALHKAVVSHAAGHPQPDDLTIVIVKRSLNAVSTRTQLSGANGDRIVETRI